jgi:hypothetical protein
MKRGTWTGDRNLLLEHSRGGIIRVAQLERLGVPTYTTYRRCAPDGPWQWILPGIVALDRAPITERRRLDSALLHAGSDSMVTGAAACRVYGLRNAPEDDKIHVLVPAGRQVRSFGHALIERTRWYPNAQERHGIPIAPLTRAVLDCARRLRSFDPVRKLLIEAVQRGGCQPGALRLELENGSQRGTALPRRVLGEIANGVWSVAEAHTEKIWRRAGLSSPMRNGDLFDVDGQFIARPDLWWDGIGLAWEIDSFAFHFSARDYAKTVTRNTRYARAGIVVVQTLPTQLRDDPEGVANDLAAAARVAAGRGRPRVIFRPRAA